MVNLSVGLQRPLGWDRARPCATCGALVFASTVSVEAPVRCQVCTGVTFDGDDDWPANGWVVR